MMCVDCVYVCCVCFFFVIDGVLYYVVIWVVGEWRDTFRRCLIIRSRVVRRVFGDATV